MDCTLYSVMLSWMSLCFSISNMLDLRNSVFAHALAPSIVQQHSSDATPRRIGLKSDPVSAASLVYKQEYQQNVLKKKRQAALEMPVLRLCKFPSQTPRECSLAKKICVRFCHSTSTYNRPSTVFLHRHLRTAPDNDNNDLHIFHGDNECQGGSIHCVPGCQISRPNMPCYSDLNETSGF